MGDVADVQAGRPRAPEHHRGPNMRPYLRVANLTWSGLDLTDVKQMNFDDHDAQRYALAVGDIVLNESSGSPGEVEKPHPTDSRFLKWYWNALLLLVAWLHRPIGRAGSTR